MTRSFPAANILRRSFMQKSGAFAVGLAATVLPVNILAKENEEESRRSENSRRSLVVCAATHCERRTTIDHGRPIF